MPSAAKRGHLEGGMVDSQRFNAEGRATQVVFLETMGRAEKALILAAVLASVAVAAYALAKVSGSVDLQAQRSQQQATTYALAQSQAAQTYQLATQQLSRDEQNRAEMLRDQFKQLQQQARLTELKLDDYNVTLRRAGIRLKGDFTRGPMGNPDAESFNVKFRKSAPVDSR